MSETCGDCSNAERSGCSPPSRAGSCPSTSPSKSRCPTTKASLTEAYEKGLLRGKQLIKVRRLIDERRQFGKAPQRGRPSGRTTRASSRSLARTLETETERQRLLIKRVEITSSRLRFVVEALRMLLADEHFVTLLRAEGVHTLPAPLARLIEERRGE